MSQNSSRNFIWFDVICQDDVDVDADCDSSKHFGMECRINF